LGRSGLEFLLVGTSYVYFRCEFGRLGVVFAGFFLLLLVCFMLGRDSS
jgi:hypothetical protein